MQYRFVIYFDKSKLYFNIINTVMYTNNCMTYIWNSSGYFQWLCLFNYILNPRLYYCTQCCQLPSHISLKIYFWELPFHMHVSIIYVIFAAFFLFTSLGGATYYSCDYVKYLVSIVCLNCFTCCFWKEVYINCIIFWQISCLWE